VKRSDFAIGIVLAAALTATGCVNPFRPALRETILQGNQFAHYLRFPWWFEYSVPVGDELQFSHVMFRIAAGKPDTLIAAGCGYLNNHEESCSANAFLIDTAHQYTITRAQADDWNKAGPVPGSLSFGDPSGWRPPYPLTVTEIDRAGSRPEQGNASGWTFRHQDFLSRGDWVTDLFPRASGNGKLVLLVGIDKRKLPTHGVFFGDAVSDGAYGNLTLDLFESSPQNESRPLIWIVGWPA
jgi:hypothetical protein